MEALLRTGILARSIGLKVKYLNGLFHPNTLTEVILWNIEKLLSAIWTLILIAPFTAEDLLLSK